MTSRPQAVLCRYHYDPLDRLAGATVSGQANALSFYQKNRLATQIHGAVQRTIIQHEELLLAQQQRIDSAIETTLLATDQQRSVLHLLDKTVPRPLTYSPYGHHPAESGISSLLGFNGEHRDPVTGHYLLGNGYRAFNPVLMRFNSPDSFSPFDEGGINAYAYCEGDPVNLVDPSGHITAVLWRGLARTGFLKVRLKRLGTTAGLWYRHSVPGYQRGANVAVTRQSSPLRLPSVSLRQSGSAEAAIVAAPVAASSSTVLSSGLATSHAPQTQMPVYVKNYASNRTYINQTEKAGFLSPDSPGTLPELELKIEKLNEVVRRGGELQDFFNMRVANATAYRPNRALKAAERYARITQTAQDLLNRYGNVSIISNPPHL